MAQEGFPRGRSLEPSVNEVNSIIRGHPNHNPNDHPHGSSDRFMANFIREIQVQAKERVKYKLQERQAMMKNMTQEQLDTFKHGDGIQTQLTENQADELEAEMGKKSSLNTGRRNVS